MLKPSYELTPKKALELGLIRRYRDPVSLRTMYACEDQDGFYFASEALQHYYQRHWDDEQKRKKAAKVDLQRRIRSGKAARAERAGDMIRLHLPDGVEEMPPRQFHRERPMLEHKYQVEIVFL